MPLDFTKLVLAPCLSTFGRPVTFTPVASQPGAPSCAAQAHHAVRITAFPLRPASLQVPATHHRIACTIARKSSRIIHHEGPNKAINDCGCESISPPPTLHNTASLMDARINEPGGVMSFGDGVTSARRKALTARVPW